MKIPDIHNCLLCGECLVELRMTYSFKKKCSNKSCGYLEKYHDNFIGIYQIEVMFLDKYSIAYSPYHENTIIYFCKYKHSPYQVSFKSNTGSLFESIDWARKEIKYMGF